MKSQHFAACALPFLAAALLIAPGPPIGAGSFSTAGESFGEDVVKHPVGYDGITGGDLILSVCLDPADPESASAEAAIFFAVQTWNSRFSTTANIDINGEVPPGALDFESAALRTLGLCLGLDDPSDDAGFTRATNGANNSFDRLSGPDTVQGTADDVRGDDQNLMWFRLLDNNPFTVSANVVDSTTYSRDTAVLPEGDQFAATSTRAVADTFGLMDTEAVMVADLQPGESKRRLTFDDIATLRYAETGIDEITGTSDDYRVRLDFIGLADSCDLRVTFDTQGSLATCFGGAQRIDGNHFGFTSSTLTFSDAVQWHFGDLQILFVDGFETGDLTVWSSSSP